MPVVCTWTQFCLSFPPGLICGWCWFCKVTRYRPSPECTALFLFLSFPEWHHFHFSLSDIGVENGNPLQCSCLENPRDVEPGGLPSMGSHRVRHDCSDLAAAAREYEVPRDNRPFLDLSQGFSFTLERGPLSTFWLRYLKIKMFWLEFCKLSILNAWYKGLQL